MTYVSAKYGPPYNPPMPEGSPKPVLATDEEGRVWSLTDDSQVGEWLEYIEGGGTIDPADPVVPPDPYLREINRGVGIIGNPPVAVTCHGENFKPTSVIFVDNKLKRNTVFISDKAVTCTVDPMNETPRQVEVYVRTGTHSTNKLLFTFIAREAPA